MKIRRHEKKAFSETAASSDLAFILIIYFLVIAGFNVNFGFLIDLPEKGSIRMVQRDELMRFEMDHAGTIFLGGEELNIREAEEKIRASMLSRPGLAVVLSIDKEAPWQKVVNFVEAAQNLRVESFSFNMRDES